MQTVTRDELCAKHNPDLLCQFTGAPCDKIGIENGYCTLHRENVQHQKEKSRHEVVISEILTNAGIAFINNIVLPNFDGTYCQIDFYLPEFNAAIEFDGKQHFEVVKLWRGIEGLQKRIAADIMKDALCFVCDIKLLRLSYRDVDHLVDYIRAFLTSARVDNYATPFYAYLTREYEIITL